MPEQGPCAGCWQAFGAGLPGPLMFGPLHDSSTASSGRERRSTSTWGLSHSFLFFLRMVAHIIT